MAIAAVFSTTILLLAMAIFASIVSSASHPLTAVKETDHGITNKEKSNLLPVQNDRGKEEVEEAKAGEQPGCGTEKTTSLATESYWGQTKNKKHDDDDDDSDHDSDSDHDHDSESDHDHGSNSDHDDDSDSDLDRDHGSDADSDDNDDDDDDGSNSENKKHAVQGRKGAPGGKRNDKLDKAVKKV